MVSKSYFNVANHTPAQMAIPKHLKELEGYTSMSATAIKVPRYIHLLIQSFSGCYFHIPPSVPSSSNHKTAFPV